MIVLSHFRGPAAASLVNHRRYAEALGYEHIVVDAGGMTNLLPLALLYKYEVLLGALARLRDGELLLLLGEDAAIVGDTPLERLARGRDWLFFRTSMGESPEPDVQIWRGGPSARDLVLRLIKRCKLGADPLIEAEADLLVGLDAHPCLEPIDDIFPVIPAGAMFDPLWARTPTFAISIGEAHGPDFPRTKAINPRLRDVLVAHINQHLLTGAPLLAFDAPDAGGMAERSLYNPGQAIALTTLHTPAIAGYAGIAERSLRRYCEHNGYTLYVHRDLPAEIGLEASGNWFKPWLLHGYMPHHEWIIWLDADVLICDQRRRLEPLLEGRDRLMAHDVGQWPLNSGVLGFRRTEENRTLLEALMQDIQAVPDRSNVYASDGDQLFFIRALERRGLLGDDAVSDLVTVNTPWMFRRRDSFMVHYFGMWPEMRALMMTHDAAQAEHDG